MFESYTNLSQEYTSQGQLRRSETVNQPILQTVCTDYNSYVLLNDGRLYAMGTNSNWQCTEIDSYVSEMESCVPSKFLEINREE